MDFDFTLDDSGLVCEPQAAYKANNELTRAWEIVEKTASNLFLTGRAGTGKTTFLKKLRESSAKRMVVLAPTGVAAINASGSTMHSFFQLPFSVYIPGKGFAGNDKRFLNVSRKKKRLIASLSLLVIDEISMVKPDTLDAIDSILRRLRGNSEPFGGLQLLLIGDLRQLPPVVKDEEWNLVKDFYASPYFFESHALKKAGFHTIELTTVYRQSDSEFLEILNSIRDGRASSETLSSLNRRFIPGFNPADSEGYIRLTTHNRLADQLNASRLATLPGPEFTFEAEVEGKFPETSFPADRILRLKGGAQVMFVKNDTGSGRRFYNGLIGKITAISENKISVAPAGGGSPIEVEKAEWEITQYRLDEVSGKILQEPVGTFRQYPLQPAWAVTIHKSQGLTFDRAIIDAAHSFAPGQTYVALSRCRSLEGLVLGSPLPPGAVITDAGINEFIDYYTRHTPDAESIERMKLAYSSSLLKKLFDFVPLRNAFCDFQRTAMEFLVPIYPEVEAELKEIKETIECRLIDVAVKFLSSSHESDMGAMLQDPHSSFCGRVMKGSEYFHDTLEDVEAALRNLPRKVENSAYAQRLENTFGFLQDAVCLKTMMLEALSEEPFSVEAFLNAKARATLSVEKEDVRTVPKRGKRRVAAAGEENKEEKKKSKRPKGYSTFETLKLFREGLGIPEIAVKRNLAESTIASHIADLIRLEKIKLEEVADPAVIEEVRRTIALHPEMKFTDLADSINSHHPDAPLPKTLISVIWNLK